MTNELNDRLQRKTEAYLQTRLILLDSFKSFMKDSHSLVNEELHSIHFSSDTMGSISFSGQQEEEGEEEELANGGGGVRFICFSSAFVRNLKGCCNLAAVAAAAAAARCGNGWVAKFNRGFTTSFWTDWSGGIVLKLTRATPTGFCCCCCIQGNGVRICDSLLVPVDVPTGRMTLKLPWLCMDPLLLLLLRMVALTVATGGSRWITCWIHQNKSKSIPKFFGKIYVENIQIIHNQFK